MFLLHNGIYINYEIEGKGRPVICLHGWGTNNTSFDKQIEYFKDNYCFYKIDLPGFGFSDEPKTVYNLDNYVEVIEKLTKIEKIENPLIICHSFGNRVAVKYCLKNPVKSLIIIGGAGIKRFNLINKIKVLKYKIKKKYYKLTKNYLEYNFLIRNSGSIDYKNASIMMKKILKSTTNENIKKYLKYINCPTLLIWGKNDSQTEINDARLMNKKIKNSLLYELDGDHFIHVSSYCIVNDIIERFLGDIYQ